MGSSVVVGGVFLFGGGGGLKTCPLAKPAAVRSICWSITPSRLSSVVLTPQQGRALFARHWLAFPVVIHLSNERTGLPPPFVKSNRTRTSPGERTGVTPLPAQFGGCGGVRRALPGSHRNWWTSKSMFAEPNTFV